MSTTLDRTTFRTNREMDFFSQKELTTQTGHPIDEWPLVILKELVDNSLDACEQANIAPDMKVVADSTGITVADNGPGIPDDTIAGACDFTVRVSNREQYVAPDRGAQGNALMTLLSMPYVVDPDEGQFLVTANGVRHNFTCRADQISQRVIVEDVTEEVKKVPGTVVRVCWAEHIDDDGQVVWPFGTGDSDDEDVMYPLDERDSRWSCPTISETFLSMVRGYAVFNPHLTLAVDWFGDVTRFEATNASWSKWKPNKPTSPHWYEHRHLERLIAAYISHDRDHDTDRTVADFVKEFDGLTGSKKRKVVLDEAGLSRVKLSALAKNGELSSDTIAKLLAAMKHHTKEVKPARLGIIGRDHIVTRFTELGADPEHIEYSKVARIDNGVPFVLESAFVWLGDDAADKRHIFAGANWSPGIENPFRSFGQSGEGLESLLHEQRVGSDEPIVFMLHLAHPRVEYTDRAKSAIVIQEEGAE